MNNYRSLNITNCTTTYFKIQLIIPIGPHYFNPQTLYRHGCPHTYVYIHMYNIYVCVLPTTTKHSLFVCYQKQLALNVLDHATNFRPPATRKSHQPHPRPTCKCPKHKSHFQATSQSQRQACTGFPWSFTRSTHG